MKLKLVSKEIYDICSEIIDGIERHMQKCDASGEAQDNESKGMYMFFISKVIYFIQ